MVSVGIMSVSILLTFYTCYLSTELNIFKDIQTDHIAYIQAAAHCSSKNIKHWQQQCSWLSYYEIKLTPITDAQLTPPRTRVVWTKQNSRDQTWWSRMHCRHHNDEQHDFLFCSAPSPTADVTPMPRGPGLVGDKSSSSGLSQVCFCDTTL